MRERLVEAFAMSDETFAIALGVVTASYLVWAVVFWRVRRRRRMQERLLELQDELRVELRAVREPHDWRRDEDQTEPDEDQAEVLREGPSPSVIWGFGLQMERLQTRISSLETRMDDLRSDFDVAGELRRRASQRPLLAVLIAGAATIVATAVGSLLSALLQRLLPPA